MTTASYPTHLYSQEHLQHVPVWAPHVKRRIQKLDLILTSHQ